MTKTIGQMFGKLKKSRSRKKNNHKFGKIFSTKEKKEISEKIKNTTVVSRKNIRNLTKLPSVELTNEIKDKIESDKILDQLFVNYYKETNKYLKLNGYRMCFKCGAILPVEYFNYSKVGSEIVNLVCINCIAASKCKDYAEYKEFILHHYYHINAGLYKREKIKRSNS